MRERGINTPPALHGSIDNWTERGASVLHLVRGVDVVGAFAVEDEVRSEARAAIEELDRLGVRVVMITGDARQVADGVAAQLGIDEVFAEVLPGP